MDFGNKTPLQSDAVNKISVNLRSIGLATLMMLSILFLAACGSGSGEGLDENGDPVDEGGDDGNNTSLFAPVQAIFTAQCTLCHSGAGASAGLVLSEGLSHAAIVNVASSQQPNLQLVTPNDAEASYLVRKVRGDVGISGGQMPLNRTPLTANQVTTITTWINAGAANDVNILANKLLESVIPSPEELHALSFYGYENWDRLDSVISTKDAWLSFLANSAHGGFEGEQRQIYQQTIAAENYEQQKYMAGTRFIIETRRDGEVIALAAMIKQSESLESKSGNWLWLTLDPRTLRVTVGAKNEGLNSIKKDQENCQSCHENATLARDGIKDFVF